MVAGKAGPQARATRDHPECVQEGFPEAAASPFGPLTFALGFLSRQSTPSGKRYKFVATGHGKYEKVLMDEGSGP